MVSVAPLGLRRRGARADPLAPSASTRSTSTTDFATPPPTTSASCRRLCAALRIDLHVERPRASAGGNLQAAARAARYEAAERLREPARRRPGSRPATRRTDAAETVVYRLAVSPGRRAPPRASRRGAGRVDPPAARARPREESRALARDGRASLRGRRDEPRPRLRPQPDPHRGPAGARASSTRRPSGTSPRRAPSWARRRRCSSASRSRHSQRAARAPSRSQRSPPTCSRAGEPGAAAPRPARARRARRRPPGRRSGARAPPRSRASRTEPEGGEVDLGGGLQRGLRVGHGPLRACDPPTPRPSRCRPADASRRAAGSATGSVTRRASPGAGRRRPGPSWRRSTRAALGEHARRAHVARGRPHPPARHGRDEDARRPLRRPRGPALAAPPASPSSPAGDRVAWVAGVAVSERLPARRPRPRAAAVITARVAD